MDPTFTATSDRTAIEIADSIENARFELHTPTPVTPTRTPAEEFYFPVDSAVAVETTAIGVPKLMNVYVRTQSGELVADNADHEDRTLSDVNVKAFVLNACRSYEQVEALVEAGSYGGVVTLAEVANSVATDIGQTLARLLNCGFPLRVALSIVKDTIAPAYQYSSVGDGGLTLCQSESGVPIHLKITSVTTDTYEFEFITYPVDGHGMGTLNSPLVQNDGTSYLGSGTVETFKATGAELDEFLDREVMPVEYDSHLYWSNQLSASEIGD